MPKAEKGSVKDLANRMKAKGLQKLRFYCQMCQKQCRDANGFKCHIQSESHMRQMKIFSDNAGGFLERYSREFESSFLTTLKMRHGSKKVNANNVYQELIADKQHIHMNATHWTTLTEFVQYLGKSGKCVVEENQMDGNGGWYVSYIERDSGILARRASQQRREAADQKAEAALLERMKAQRIAAAKALDRAGGSVTVSATSILGDGEGDTQECVSTLQKGLGAALLSSSKTTKKKATAAKRCSAFGDEDDEDQDENDSNDKPPNQSASIATTSAPRMETAQRDKTSIKTKDAATKKRKHDDNRNNNPQPNRQSKDESTGKRSRNSDGSGVQRREGGTGTKQPSPTDAWLYRNILVRIVSKRLAGGKYFRKKAVVDKVLENGYTAEVEVLDDSKRSDVDSDVDGDVLRLDQDDLETVIPKTLSSGSGSRSQKVRILKGDYRGEKATVEFLDKSRERAELLLCKSDRRLKKVSYDNFSQIA
eukprot:CAMPEP_0172368664 /NCGR_PEP_ID=MMETSP1060-20121228/28621_1 /TAXON_ID=37318 /ORGANISM="Pseudo-nitzschia pungens, Strain cf. cingulata" /LENGTH=479 /DNA_ID=CAMNT_0013093335 /DNA_START=42 /DNA_END=1484 /DNA_ORIENTATION=+